MNPYQLSKEQGYSDAEIMQHLETHPKYADKIKKSREAGYSDEEIGNFLSAYQEKPEEKERSLKEQASRLPLMLGAARVLGTVPGIAYETAAAIQSTPEAQKFNLRQQQIDDFNHLIDKKAYGLWEEGDKEMYEMLKKQISEPSNINVEKDKIYSQLDKFLEKDELNEEEKKKFEELQNQVASLKEPEPLKFGIKDIIGKYTGLDLHPEGVIEKAAEWATFIRNPRNWKDLLKNGLTKKDVIKNIAPTYSEAMRGIGAGVALEAAEEGQFGPIGTMAAVIIGDVIGAGKAKISKEAVKLITEPKKTLAEYAAKLTNAEKKQLQSQIVEEFRKSGLQADLGTITDSNLIKWTQARLSQSGLTGKALDEFKENLIKQVINEYKNVAEGVGESIYATEHHAGEVLRDAVKNIRDADLAQTRSLYEKSIDLIKENAFVSAQRLSKAVDKIKSSLKPGQLKSAEQKSVLNALEKLERDYIDSSGNLLQPNVKDLINNKIALNDIINYEVQGGAKQLLKGVVSELDRAIISYGKENPSFAKNYIQANKRFSQHAKTFRNKNIDSLMRITDPAQALNKMNSIQGIREIKNILFKSPEGKKLYNDLSRFKLEQVVGKNLGDGATQQAKLGTFSKILDKGKNRQVIRELLDPKSYNRLVRLQKNVGRLIDAADKFYNASKSGVVAADAAIIGKGLADLGHLLYGNPYPLLKTTTGLGMARILSNYLADPQFLKYVEDAIIASQKNSTKQLNNSVKNLFPYFAFYIQNENKEL